MRRACSNLLCALRVSIVRPCRSQYHTRLMPSKPLEISLPQAQRLSLACQGLLRPDPFGRGKAGALAALEHLGYVQIDTISVVERAHHHVLWSRVPGYQPSQLAELQREGKVFEYWSHAASF